MSHYYTDNADLPSDRRSFSYHFDNEVFEFTTDNGVFSKGGVDYGSYLLIRSVYRRDLGKRVLDLGSGFGPIGIIIKRFNPSLRIEMVDVNSRATELCRFNALANHTEIDEVHLCEDISELKNCFDSIILNPPIRAGKSVIYGLYQKSYEKLNAGGSLYIVIQKKQGAPSSYKFLKELFNFVEVLDKDGGYIVYQAQK